MMENKLPEKIQKLKELLNKIGYEIRGRYPNTRIYAPNGKYTGYRVLNGYIQLENSFNDLCSSITSFYFKGGKIEMIDNNCVSVGTTECFVLFMNHNITKAKDGNNEELN